MRGGKGMHLSVTAIETEFKGSGEWLGAIARRDRIKDIFNLFFK